VCCVLTGAVDYVCVCVGEVCCVLTGAVDDVCVCVSVRCAVYLQGQSMMCVSVRCAVYLQKQSTPCVCVCVCVCVLSSQDCNKVLLTNINVYIMCYAKLMYSVTLLLTHLEF